MLQFMRPACNKLVIMNCVPSDLANYVIDARHLWRGEVFPEHPLLIVDLEATRDWPEIVALPPMPVIGVGDRAHPFASQLDTVIEAPIRLPSLAENILRAPRAAMVIAGLLRILPDLPREAGLTAESLAYGVLQGSAEHRAWLAARPASQVEAPGKLRVEPIADGLRLTLDRDHADNAIDRTMRDALYEGLSLGALDPDIVRIELHAVGRSFSQGADLAEFGTTTDPATAHDIRMRTLPATIAAACADKMFVHVQGPCVGAGLELAAFARSVTATSAAWFQLPELAMGILPGAGGCVSLTHRIGRQRTALMILSGKRIPAATALAWGLIDAIVDESSADPTGADII